MKCEVKNLDGRVVSFINLPESIFCLESRSDIIDRVIRWQLAKRRSGTHKTCTISYLSGTTKKPWKQKGTGRARAGSLRAPQFRKGAIPFGPVVRSHEYSLQKKVRSLGLKIALAIKWNEKKIIILDDLSIKEAKVRPLLTRLTNMGVKNALIIDVTIERSFFYSLRNVHGIDVLPTQGTNVYDIMRHDFLVLTEKAVESLEQRLILGSKSR